MNVSPALLSVAAVLIINSIGFAFYVGKLSGRVDQNQKDIAGLKDLCRDIQEVQNQSGRAEDRMGFRVGELEKLERKVDDLRTAIAQSTQQGATERAQAKAQSEKMEREIGGIHRQLANIASGRTGLIELTTPMGKE